MRTTSIYRKMKRNINEACDLSSISVLPPQTRRPSASYSGLDSSSSFGRSQMASQLRPQQPLQSQPPHSQGVSCQTGLLSQFSQNSQDEIVTNERIGSQERDVSARRTPFLPQVSYAREESQMMVSRSSNNLMRKLSSQEYKCQISEELEHRIGMIETSLSRLGMIVDSIQSDIMQVNKGTKEITLEMEGVRQKLIVVVDSMQSMMKGHETIRMQLDLELKTLSAHLEAIKSPGTEHKNDFGRDGREEVQPLSRNMKFLKQKKETPPVRRPKAIPRIPSSKIVRLQNKCTAEPSRNRCATAQLVGQNVSVPTAELGGWTSVKQQVTTCKVGGLDKGSNPKKTPRNQMEQENWILVESDEELDGGFSCLLKVKETDGYSIEEAKEETARILRKARRRKRKYCNTIIIN